MRCFVFLTQRPLASGYSFSLKIEYILYFLKVPFSVFITVQEALKTPLPVYIDASIRGGSKAGGENKKSHRGEKKKTLYFPFEVIQLSLSKLFAGKSNDSLQVGRGLSILTS